MFHRVWLLGLGVWISGCAGGAVPSSTVPQCTIDDSTSNEFTEGVGVISASLGGEKLAQSFKLSADLSVSKIYLKVARDGEPTGDLTLDIQGSSGATNSVPNGAPIARSTFIVSRDSNGDFNLDKVPYYTLFSFSSPIVLSKDIEYWLVLSASYPTNDTDYFVWSTSADDPYANGLARYYDRAQRSWDSIFFSSGHDFLFKLGCSP